MTNLLDSLGLKISIHAPHERCDFQQFHQLIHNFLFQSTHRMSDATYWYIISENFDLFQSTHRMSDATVDKKLKDV